ncbi:uncharacterized protein [Periplaneta americana]|uniref:uncharacterized protein n=1 Tax=Periplaneta americana TaxID=6978 RepID=UPI0037E87598
MWFEISVAAIFLQVARTALPLPPYVQPCARSDPQFNDCVLRGARNVLPHIVKGDRKYHIPSLDPFLIQDVKVTDPCSKVTGINLLLKDVEMRGMKDTVIHKIHYDFEKQHIHHEAFIPRLICAGKYEAWGHFMLVPYRGKGIYNFTHENVVVTYESDFTLETIGSNTHMVQKNPNSTFTSTKSHYYVGDLFKGNQMLNKLMNDFIDENVYEVSRGLYPIIAGVFQDMIFKVMNEVDRKVPFDVVFPEKLPVQNHF